MVKRSHVNAKVNEILSKERDAARPAELSGLSLLVNQYRFEMFNYQFVSQTVNSQWYSRELVILFSDSDEDGNSDTSNSDEDSDGLEVRNAL